MRVHERTRTLHPQQLLALETERGCIWSWRLAPDVYASEVEGYLDLGMAQLIIKQADPMYEVGRVDGFHYWFDMTGYDSQARVELTNWVTRHRSRSRLFIGVRSKIVAMGVSVANLALGNLIRTYAATPELDLALEKRLSEKAPRKNTGR